MRRFYAVVFMVAACVCTFAQDDSTSLGDAARRVRENKPAAAKKTITEENLDGNHGPIPDLNLDGHDNTPDIIRAIGEYRYKHTAEETEQVVRDWYNRYDHMMQRAADENAEIRSRQQDRRILPREYPNDPKQYRETMLSEARSAAQDEKLLRSNGLMAGRIQSAFYKIKSDLNFKYKINYEWLKPSAQYW